MHPSVYARDFADFSKTFLADEIEFYMDASKNFELGFGRYCEKSWMYGIWGPVVADLDPSIQYLELYAQTAGILAWISRFKNRRVVIFCDNQSVVHMINNTSSSCPNCKVLIRIIVLYSLIYNVRIFAKYVESLKNEIADSLSCLQFNRFYELTAVKGMDSRNTQIPSRIWPLEKVWTHPQK